MSLKKMIPESAKLGVANISSWMFAVISMSEVLTFFQILAAIGGICVSAISVWYIRKKGKAIDSPKD